MLEFFKSRKHRAPKPCKAERELNEQARRILDLEAQLVARQRELDIAKGEIESLAAVILRDRERVKAETAELVRRTTVAEGAPNVSK